MTIQKAKPFVTQNSSAIANSEAIQNVKLDATLKKLDVEPRDYQRRIISKAIAMFEGTFQSRGVIEEPAKHVMIESPTGSGKTVMGLTVAKYMQEHYGYKIGWIAMRRNLLAQANAENIRRKFNIDLELISMFDKQPPQVDMMVVDEAQHDAAMSMNNLHSHIKPKKVLGLTATPFRTDRIKLCFDKVIKDAGIHALIQDGYLSRYRHFTLPEFTPKIVADCYANEPERWGKSIIFFHKHTECMECQRELANYGFKSEVVTAKTNREQQLADFAEGKFDILINMAILTEGFDCPELQTAFCRPSGKGCTVQMGGRVFRKHPDIPIKQVVQCEKTKHPFVKTATPEEQYVWSADGWRTLKINHQLQTISLNALKRIAKTDVTLPPVVMQNRSRKTHWSAFRGR